MNAIKGRLFFPGLALTLTLAVTLIFLAGCQKNRTPRIGKKAKDFQLQDLKGESYRLSHFMGKLVHLHFWADWCPRCHEEFDRMEGAYKRLKKAHPDFEILGVNVDQPKVHVEEFIKMHDITFPILLDVGAEIARSYGVKGLPCNFLIGRDGKIKELILGWVDEEYLEKSIRGMEGSR